LPDALHGVGKGSRFLASLELDVDDDVVRVVHRTQDTVAARTVPLAPGRVAVECLLPGFEISDRVFDSKDWHVGYGPG